MLISNEWLKDYVDTGVPAKDLAEHITRTGIEVADIVDYSKDIKNLVVGYVTSKERHPDADELNICQVNVGKEKLIQIVCGTPSIDENQYVIVAKVGGRLPGGIKIKHAELRGERSEGMICSLQGVGASSNVVPKDHENGVFVFPNGVTSGTDALGALYLNGQVVEFDLTPNRTDALSMVGIAYEVAALYQVEVTRPNTALNETETSATNELSVIVNNPEEVPYYSARVVKNVRITPSPIWMQARLIKADIRPINNVADVSNYVLLRYGQPLHMFDQNHIGSKDIVVRQANKNETMTALGDAERILINTDIIITSGKEPIALAGVMGEDFSEVTGQTVNAVVEDAIFGPVSIRHTSRHLNLRSESSSRFGGDIVTGFINEAVDRTYYLLERYASDEVLKSRVAQGNLGSLITPVDITAEKVNQTIGFDLSNDEIKAIFKQLRFKTIQNADTLAVYVPSHRKGISVKEDLIEEIARVYGYDNTLSTLPVFDDITSGKLTDCQYKTHTVRETLKGAGLNQAIAYSPVSKDHTKDFVLQECPAISLLMPMSEAHSILRQNLLPHLIEATAYNVARKNKNMRLYKIGRVFFSNGKDELPNEIEYLNDILIGEYVVNTRQGKKKEIDFFIAKSVIDRIAEKLNLDFAYKAGGIKGLHPGKTVVVSLEGEEIGFTGELYPQLVAENDLKCTYVFELDYDSMMRVAAGYINYESIPKFPGMSGDITMGVNHDMPLSELLDIIHENGEDILRNTLIFDVYEDEHLEEGKEPAAVRLNYLDTENTLTNERVSKVHDKILEALGAKGATIR